MSRGVREGIGLDRNEYVWGFCCVYLPTSVSMCVIQMCLRHGKFLPTYFPREPNQTWPETQKQKDITIAR